jgi:hypothetical protein
MTDSTRPVTVKKLRGRVTRGPYARGSKSEREAYFIETSDACYLLRRKGGPTFADSKLERYVGHIVECDGFLVGNTVLAELIGRVG